MGIKVNGGLHVVDGKNVVYKKEEKSFNLGEKQGILEFF